MTQKTIKTVFNEIYSKPQKRTEELTKEKFAILITLGV